MDAEDETQGRSDRLEASAGRRAHRTGLEDRTHEERKYRMLKVVDEFTHEALAIRVKCKLNSMEVIVVLSKLFLARGVPGHIRSGNGPFCTARTCPIHQPVDRLNPQP